jgi:hypothetical protein
MNDRPLASRASLAAAVVGASFAAAFAAAPTRASAQEAVGTAAAAPASVDADVAYAGVAGASVVDRGTLVVTSVAGPGREATFEFVRRPDGGTVVLESITAADGRYRLQARFDYDAAWRAESARGIGLYDGKPVRIDLRRDGDRARVAVDGDGVRLRPVAACRDCFLNLSPSALAMFVMTQHYDHSKGGAQQFTWAAQDLDRPRTLDGGRDDVTYRGEVALPRAGGTSATLRHYTFVERNPLPDGRAFVLNMDLWTDGELRPIAFRARIPSLARTGTIGVRVGYEDLRDALSALSDRTVPLAPSQ